MKRLLLPFTHGIDEQAIDNILRFARASEVKLIALAIILVPNQSIGEKIRPEQIEQATDFLETISARAQLHNIAVEQQQAYSADIIDTVWTTLQKTECQGIVLAIKEQGPCLLRAHEASQLKQTLAINFYHLCIPSQKKAKKSFLLR